MHTDVHVLFDYLLFLVSVAAIPIGLIYSVWWAWVGGIILFWFYPVLLEISIHAWACVFFSEQTYRKEIQEKRLQLASENYEPFVYHPDYNLTFCGLEKKHPFDAVKYGRIIQDLEEKFKIVQSERIWKPKMITRALLKQICGNYHLFFLNYSIYASKMIEMPICFVPACMMRNFVLNPLMLMTQGTLDAAIMSLDRGFAFNIGGGFHHSSRYKSGGFCVYPDITLAVLQLREYFGIQRSMIIDLDAHQGDGHERDFAGDTNVHIIDCYNPNIYPRDYKARKSIKTDLHITNRTTDANYLKMLELEVLPAIKQFAPQFILYNAGTDISQGDPLGGLNISDQAIIKRDEIIFRAAIEQNISICMVTSGGYQKKNAPTIAESIDNLYKKLNLAKMKPRPAKKTVD
jgi:histone deacetylase 11